MKRLISLLLVLAMVISMTACSSSSSSDSTDTDDESSESEDASTDEESDDTSEDEDDDASYTFYQATSTVNTWNPTDYEYDFEADLISYTTSPLYSFNMNEDKDGYEIVPELATDMPEDVTAEYAGDETYGVPEDATEGYAYRVTIREDAVWSNGDVINAETFEYSLSQYLNPEMQNYRASSYYSGTAALANAAAYFSGGYLAVYDSSTGEYVDTDEEYWSLTATVEWLEDSLENTYETYADYFIREDGTDIYDDLLELAGDETYVEVTDEFIELINEFGSYVWGDSTDENYYKYYTFYVGESKTWDEVGVIVEDEYTITFVFANALSEFNFIYNIGSMAILNETYYEEYKTDAGSLIKSTYNTSAESSVSCGPYMVESYQEDKEIVLVKNDSWYGYTDGEHEGMYQTTAINTTIINEHSTELSLFLQGNLDVVDLESDDMETYGTSDYAYYSPNSFTSKFSFNSDYDSLAAEYQDGESHIMLAYLNFRKAIAFAIDRQAYVNENTANCDVEFGLLNDIYMSDPENSVVYRDSEVAEQALCNVYGVDSIDDLTGYDVEYAAELFQSAYEEALADGAILESDQIVLDFHTGGSDASYVSMVEFLQDAIDTATEGTDLEGKVTINLVEDPDYYTNMMNGSVDIALATWGGADLDPYSMTACYADPTYLLEYGYDPNTETATIEIDGEEITMTMYEWYVELCSGEYANADLDVKNTILAGFEEAFLSSFVTTPVYARTDALLYSQRVVLGSDTFINSVIEFGGIQYMTYTMNDEEWEAYCEEQGNSLTY